MINEMVTHSLTYRTRVECFIFDGDKLLVGQPKGWNGYVIPGGGVDTTESAIEAIKREVLEEFGVEIHNIKPVDKPTTVIPYDKSSTHDYAKKWGGVRITTYTADYLRDNKSLYGKAGDKYIVKRITVQQAYAFFMKHAADMKSSNDSYNYKKAIETCKLLKMLNRN